MVKPAFKSQAFPTELSQSQSFKQWELAQFGKNETANTTSEHYYPRATGSIPVRGNFFAEFILL